MSMERALIGALICLTTIGWVIDVEIRRETQKYLQLERLRSAAVISRNDARKIGHLMASSYASLAVRAGAVGTSSAIVAYLLVGEPLSVLVTISALTIIFVLVLLFLGAVKAESVAHGVIGRGSRSPSRRYPAGQVSAADAAGVPRSLIPRRLSHD